MEPPFAGISCSLDFTLKEASMKVRTTTAVFLFLALLSAASFAAPQYQAGKIVKVEKQESHAHSAGGADAPLKAEVATYHVSIQLGDKVYVCSYDAHADQDMSWVEGKDVEARVKGKVVYVKKANGKEAKGSILSTAPAGNS
jgi:hypothetical protein